MKNFTNEDLELLSLVFHNYKDIYRGNAEIIKPAMALEAKIKEATDGRYDSDTTYDMHCPTTKEELITGIRDILTNLGVTEFRWADLDLGWSPILQEDKYDGNNAYGLDYVEVDGVSGSNCWDEGYWSWDELDLETIKCIYDKMSDYEDDEIEL